MASEASPARRRLLQVGSVVSTPPGSPPTWGAFAAPASGGGTGAAAQDGGGESETPFWALDLGASVEVSL